MRVFGDARQHRSAADQLDAVRDALELAAAAPTGLARHVAWVAALIDAGGLLQGLADSAFAARSRESDAPEVAAATELAMATAAACARSWTSAFTRQPAVGPALQRCAESLPDIAIEVKQPEGYAFYALYPESYLEAALRCPRARWQVIGVRSIGTSLACMVATGLGAPAPITVRPIGPPFERRIATGRDRIDLVAERYAIVDEGPGLSGSSMAGVARWLKEAGVGEERMHLFASHPGGPGREAGAATAGLWQRAAQAGRVHSVGFDEAVLRASDPAHRLATWVASELGPLQSPLRDIGGGAWRTLQRRDGEALPPAHPWQERRKFIAESGGRRWLVKFAGLGRIGAAKLERGHLLGRAGFTPEPVALCHGFLIEPWCDETPILSLPIAPPIAPRLIETIAAYLVFRARTLNAAPASGASVHELQAMARLNSEEALGAALAARWDAWLPHLDALAAQVRRVETDNRLHAWEWRVGSGAPLKTDALDHHCGHDLVGCQDIAWDVAGAIVELDLSPEDARRLVERASALGVAVSGSLVAFLLPCYLAFQLGYWRDAERASGDNEEAERLRSAAERYAGSLRSLLGSSGFGAETAS